MTDEIKPALTSREWETLRLWKAGKMIGGHVRGSTVLSLSDDLAHGAAACALYGQPFGFTREDVELLLGPWPAEVDYDAKYEYSRRTRALAARIAALLPPEK